MQPPNHVIYFTFIILPHKTKHLNLNRKKIKFDFSLYLIHSLSWNSHVSEYTQDTSQREQAVVVKQKTTVSYFPCWVLLFDITNYLVEILSAAFSCDITFFICFLWIIFIWRPRVGGVHLVSWYPLSPSRSARFLLLKLLLSRCANSSWKPSSFDPTIENIANSSMASHEDANHAQDCYITFTSDSLWAGWKLY